MYSTKPVCNALSLMDHLKTTFLNESCEHPPINHIVSNAVCLLGRIWMDIPYTYNINLTEGHSFSIIKVDFYLSDITDLNLSMYEAPLQLNLVPTVWTYSTKKDNVALLIPL